MTRRAFAALSAAVFLSAGASAGELSLYHWPTAQIEYEGTGYRETTNGWELKVKPPSPATGLRWRHELGVSALQIQYWFNHSHYEREDGNTKSLNERQTGQTRLSFHNVTADVRLPLAESRVEAIVGGQYVFEYLRRKDVVFNGARADASASEKLNAAGAYVGFHAGGGRRWYWDGEATIGHFLWTDNALETGGGSIRRGGYGYGVRLEAGRSFGRWRAGIGVVRQLYQLMVRGGREFPGGAAASLPINKTDFASPFVTVGYAY